MLEVVLNACGLFLDVTKSPDCSSGDGCGRTYCGCGRDTVLEAGVEQLVRVEFKRVTGQMESLDIFTISTGTARSTSGCRHRRDRKRPLFRATRGRSDVSDDDSEQERRMIASAPTQSRKRISASKGAAAARGLPPDIRSALRN